MTAGPHEDAERTEARSPVGAVADDDGTACPPGPGACLPRSDAVAGWPACASCGLPQAPGKEFCAFCGRRWVSAT